MNNKENLSHPVKMYWQDVPPEEEQIKNVLPVGTYCEPSNIINSTHVHIQGKPWLQNAKLKKKENKDCNTQQTKQTSSKHKVNNRNDKSEERNRKNEKENGCITSDKNKEKIDDNPNNYIKPAKCSLAELRKEDKQRVADLVREMAKFSEEKEKAVQELSNIKTNFTVKLKSLEVEKQKMIKEKDTLKEKLLRYELILKEIKEKQKNETNNQNSVETILNNHISLQDFSTDFQGYEKVTSASSQTVPETCPGNLRKTKQSNGAENVGGNLKTQIDKEQCPVEHLKGVNDFANLFFKQQDKFHHQQEILQRQIEQLQKLQESILEQQQQHIKEIQVDSKAHGNQSQKDEMACGNHVDQNDLQENPFNESPKGKYSLKLQNYISKQSKYGKNCVNAITSTEQNKGNILENANNTSHILATDTIMEDESKNNTLVSVHCLNATTKSSKIDSSVQTKSNVSIQADVIITDSKRPPIKHTGVVYKQTDVNMISKGVPTSKSNVCIGTDTTDEINKLEVCKSQISKLEESLKNISSSKLVQNTNIDTHASHKVDKSKKFTTHKEIPIVDNNSDHDSDGAQEVVKENNSMSSAIQRRHFQPASILELIDGLQPPSTSTSIDHHSFKKISFINPVSPARQQSSHRNPLSPNHRQVKSKSRNEYNTKLQKVCAKLKGKQTHSILKQRQMQERSLEDQEEQKMLADVFFVR